MVDEEPSVACSPLSGTAHPSSVADEGSSAGDEGSLAVDDGFFALYKSILRVVPKSAGRRDDTTLLVYPPPRPIGRATTLRAAEDEHKTTDKHHMPTTPNSRIGKVQFYESHLGPWAEHADEIGLSQADITSLAGLTAAARASFGRMSAAREAALAATHDFYTTVTAMHAGPGAGSDMIDTIKNFAQATDDPRVYAMAQLPAPGPRNALPPPGKPTRFRVSLLGNGAVELRWHCKNPAGTAGTVYEIFRAVASNTCGDHRTSSRGPMEFVATVGAKSFTDTTIPAGTPRVIYQLTALRSTLRGDPAEFNVNFGTRDNAAHNAHGKTDTGMAA